MYSRLTAPLRGVIAAVVLLALAVPAASPALAGAAGPLDLRYRLSWAGLPIAEIRLQHRLNDRRYRSEIEVETIGLLDQLLGYRAQARATGDHQEADLVPRKYQNAYQSHRKSRRVLIRFDPATGDVVELEITKRGEPDRSKVPESLQKGVVDPLTAFFELRQQAAAAMAGGGALGFAAAVFDGRRRYDLDARLIGREQATVAGREWSVIKLELTLVWIAGSNQDDTDGAEAEADTFRLELLLSDDERLIPLQLQTLGSMFTAKVELLPECAGPDGCPAISG